MPERSTVASPAHDARPADAKRPLLVCFSHLRWDFVWQRPQHLLSRAAQTYRVLVVEEPHRHEGASPRMDVSERPGGVRIAAPILPTGMSHEAEIDAQRELVEGLLEREAGAPRVFWYYTPMALAFTSHLDCDACVYDNMDELSAFRGASPELLSLEEDLFRRVDVVFTGGMSLYEAKRSRHRNVHGLPSSIDVSHFGKARGLAAEPADMAGIPRPRLGFFGVIDERMDVELVGACADLRPDWQFVMIGPVVKIDPASLPQRANLRWIGGRDYKDLPGYLASWDIGLMPFAINEATRFISPTKTPEFLAAGLPVVSTPITDVVRPYGEKGLVEIAMTPLEVVRKAEALMARGDEERAAWLARVDRHLAAGSWDKTWATMNGHIAEALGETPDRSRARAGAATLPAYAATPAE